jgi:hypothetical protein
MPVRARSVGPSRLYAASRNFEQAASSLHGGGGAADKETTKVPPGPPAENVCSSVVEIGEPQMIDPDLIRRVRDGSYVVDPGLVAGAMIARRREVSRLLRMFPAAQAEGRAVRAAEDGSGVAGPHLA